VASFVVLALVLSKNGGEKKDHFAVIKVVD
jgi:hypothetical protein